MPTAIEKNCARELREIVNDLEGRRGHRDVIEIAGRMTGVYVAFCRQYGMTLDNVLQVVRDVWE